MENFWRYIDYYQCVLGIVALVGIVGFTLLPSRHRRDSSIILSLAILVVVAAYEIMAAMLASLKFPNFWVYNLFNSHLTAVLFMLLIRSFLKRKSHKNLVSLFIGLFLLISLVLHLTGFVHYNDSGEYILFLNAVFILCSCGLYFFELITLDEYLEIDPLKEFSFWATTAILFYFSSSFMIYISWQYLYTNHWDIYIMVKEIPRNMVLLCNLLLCFGVCSPILKERLKLEIVHV
ncbi:MAG: hypothetical protein ACK4SF_03520 [Algoriphagus aquaeductus]|uniref:hypothetical protein n=1 Tax=Algoriphagus aquaeductus TaxID=475299 RepID=UPI003918C2D3